VQNKVRFKILTSKYHLTCTVNTFLVATLKEDNAVLYNALSPKV
jgi:HKD family nuclease